MIPFAANAASTAAAKIANAFGRPGQPQNCPFPRDFVTLPEKDQATAIGNMHRKIGRDRACGSGDTFAYSQTEQTDRQTDTQAY